MISALKKKEKKKKALCFCPLPQCFLKRLLSLSCGGEMKSNINAPGESMGIWDGLQISAKVSSVISMAISGKAGNCCQVAQK